MTGVEALLAQVNIILVRPKRGENVGSAARSVCTMGIGRLAVVGNCPDDLDPALKTATHHAADVIHNIVYYDTVEAAVSGCSLVVGTTARHGRQRMVTTRVADLPAVALPTLHQGGTAAILFGPEDTGLANAELALCGVVVTIPTASRFSSLNLAQAVMIVCYELYQHGAYSLGESERYPLQQPRVADRQEVDSLLDAASRACKVLDSGSARKLADLRLRHLRQALSRYAISAREVKIFKDACHQVVKRLQRAEGE